MEKRVTGALPTDQVEGVYHRRIGDAVVTALSDGHLQPPLAVLRGVEEGRLRATLAEAFRPDPPPLSVNAFLVRARGRTALVDAGGGGIAPTLGRMAAALVGAGLNPADVDTVLLTHLHRDHVGGLVDASGQVRFHNATLHAHQDEIDFWLNPARAEGLDPSLQQQFTIAAQSLGPYGGRLEGFRGEQEVFPGVFSVEMPGHAPGHCGWRIGAGAEALLIWGDLLHFPEIQARHPEAGLVFDWNPEQAIATRRRVLDMAAKDRLLVAGMHLHFPAFAHVAYREGAYAVVPEPWATRL